LSCFELFGVVCDYVEITLYLNPNRSEAEFTEGKSSRNQILFKPANPVNPVNPVFQKNNDPDGVDVPSMLKV
jgi:hypothetical protein